MDETEAYRSYLLKKERLAEHPTYSVGGLGHWLFQIPDQKIYEVGMDLIRNNKKPTNGFKVFYGKVAVRLRFRCDHGCKAKKGSSEPHLWGSGHGT